MKPTTTLLFYITVIFSFFITNSNAQNDNTTLWTSYDETQEIKTQQEHANPRMRFKLIQSKFLDKNEVFQKLASDVSKFSEKRYNQLKPLVLEKDIPSIQKAISEGKLTYEELTLFYLSRIFNYELDKDKTLHTIIALNPNILEQAKEKDKNKSLRDHLIYGMPILLKDNINTANLKTTAGAKVLEDNQPSTDAFIVSQLKKRGASILGKVNLSEWAYYFCQGCPLGYSAVGGQTLNPYGRKQFETGGSSSGSGTATAANYAVAAVGTETAGSIISPSAQNSLVGLKPTVGVLSRTGIIPISHTLDTPGPMTKNIIDNAILLDAMTGKDETDIKSVSTSEKYIEAVKNTSIKGKRLGVIKSLLSDSIYAATVSKLKNNGAEIIEYTPQETPLNGFLNLLNLEMKQDLPAYLKVHASKNISVSNLNEVMAFNKKDSLQYMPYNQGIFDAIIADTTSQKNFEKIKAALKQSGNSFFQKPIKEYQLDAILSINNYHSAHAAVAIHPCLTIPMGYKKNGEPIGITLIASPFSEIHLYKMGSAIESVLNSRKLPTDYTD
ncbi:amidase [Marixanthomonas sp. SCSIO 43207]|uniref:amidase family protein n=1 Tax=Marixanthomonas sp. SCSIO 43207 TaxID=2779360 RepID=UPI001CA92AAD|nr:amidase family protein [Marixanthomonas sp. SCSIO 43207]UAB81516.1 amidase [Marixanthomonas sp. SCSIO 43207]